MLTFQKRWTYHDAYADATIDVLYDEERDEVLHLIRDVVTADAAHRYENVNLVVRATDIPEDVVNEAVRVHVRDVVEGRHKSKSGDGG